jgi:hypothetical protein
MPHNYVSIVVIAALILFGLYRRVRRTIGFQPLNRRRLTMRSIIFIVIGLLILAAASVDPTIYIFDAAGTVIGLILAYFAISNTQYEQRADGWYYRPNGWISAIVLLLFFGRLVYRVVYALDMSKQLSHVATAQGTTPAHLQANTYVADPWTAGMIFVLFAYYACYYLFLVRKEKHLVEEQSS